MKFHLMLKTSDNYFIKRNLYCLLITGGKAFGLLKEKQETDLNRINQVSKLIAPINKIKHNHYEC